MKTWFVSQNGTVTTSLLALLVFLGRAFIDYHYVYSEFGLGMGTLTFSMLLNLALFGGWIWGLLKMVQGSHRGIKAVLGFNVFFLLVVAVGTLVAYCPSPCQTAWPLAEIANWLSLFLGLLATTSAAAYLARRAQS
ncbi:MAG: hypothetical protein D6802_07660 [Ardenticatenia bacterium]|nr:MAG: hypothetical protein D6802_07660 [Ardenticatenia bacterium]